MATDPKKSAQSASPIMRYTIIPIFTLLLGIIIGALGNELLQTVNRVENEALITAAISQVPMVDEYELADTLFTALRTGQPPPPNPNRRFEVVVEDDPIIGSGDGSVVMIEFSDFQCSFCKRFHDQTLQPLLDTYGDRIQFVYRDFAILGQASVEAAMAAECADEQGEFWDYHNQLFANQAALGRSTYLQIATELELDLDEFTVCLDEQRYLEEVQTDTSEAQQLGATGTPTFYINGRYISGAQPYEVFARVIEEELAQVTE